MGDLTASYRRRGHRLMPAAPRYLRTDVMPKDPGMPTPVVEPKEQELRSLDQRSSRLWGFATAVMVALALTVAALYLVDNPGAATDRLPVPVSRRLLAR